ncbi:MAG: hypothetical protein CMH30_08955 [Micavibrio sp.]|nr:hypothetical protein [Micavibrio sp.]
MVCINKAACLLLAFLLALLPSFAAYAEAGYTPIPRYAQHDNANQQNQPRPYIDYQPSPAYEKAVEKLRQQTPQATQANIVPAQYIPAQAEGAQNDVYGYQLPGALSGYSNIASKAVSALQEFFSFILETLQVVFGFLDNSTQDEVANNSQAADKLQTEAMATDSFYATRDAAILDAQQSDNIHRAMEKDAFNAKLPLDVAFNSGLVGLMCRDNSTRQGVSAALVAGKVTVEGLAEIQSDKNAQTSTGSYSAASGGGGGGGGTGPDDSGNPDDSSDASNKENIINEGPGAAGPLDEINDRWGTVLLFCNPGDPKVEKSGDMNGAAKAFCPATCSEGQGAKCNYVAKAYKDAAGRDMPGLLPPINARDRKTGGAGSFKKDNTIYNMDTSYYKAINGRKTWGLGYYLHMNEATGKADKWQKRSLASDEAIAEFFLQNVFRTAVTPLPRNVIEESIDEDTGLPSLEAVEFLLNHKSLSAQRSVAQNVFINQIAYKRPSPVENRYLFDQAQDILLGNKLNDPSADKPQDAYENYKLEIMGDPNKKQGPSYEAQLEYLAKLVYLNPDFIISKAPEDFENKMQLMAATKNIVTYDLLESMKRQEAVMATILEVLLTPKQRELEEKSELISQGGQ